MSLMCARLSLLVFLAVPLSAAAQAPVVPSDVPPAAQQPFAEAMKYEQAGEMPGAMDGLHAALKASHNHCLSCLEALARVQLKMEAFKDAAGQELSPGLPELPAEFGDGYGFSCRPVGRQYQPIGIFQSDGTQASHLVYAGRAYHLSHGHVHHAARH